MRVAFFFAFVVAATLIREFGFGEFGLADRAGKCVLFRRYLDVSQAKSLVRLEILCRGSRAQPKARTEGTPKVLLARATVGVEIHVVQTLRFPGSLLD